MLLSPSFYPPFVETVFTSDKCNIFKRVFLFNRTDDRSSNPTGELTHLIYVNVIPAIDPKATAEVTIDPNTLIFSSVFVAMVVPARIRTIQIASTVLYNHSGVL